MAYKQGRSSEVIKDIVIEERFNVFENLFTESPIESIECDSLINPTLDEELAEKEKTSTNAEQMTVQGLQRISKTRKPT